MIQLEPQYPDYEVVIPTFERPKMLGALIHQIRACNDYKPPKRVIIVDDASSPESVEKIKAVREECSDSRMRVSLILREEQGGYQAAMRDGLEYVETKYAVVCADDIRLAQEFTPGNYAFPTDSNPFTTLTYYLAETERVRNNLVEGAEEAHVPHPVGLMIPWGLRWETPGTVATADQEVFTLRTGVLPLVADQKSGFGINALAAVEDLHFYEGSLGAHFCFALDMSVYRSIGGFAPDLDGPNMYSFWDYTLRARNTGAATYFTTRATYLHRSQPYRKHAKSLSDAVAHGATTVRTGEVLLKRWGHYAPRVLNRPINPAHSSYQGMMNNAWSG